MIKYICDNCNEEIDTIHVAGYSEIRLEYHGCGYTDIKYYNFCSDDCIKNYFGKKENKE